MDKTFTLISQAIGVEHIRYAMVRTKRPRPELPSSDHIRRLVNAAMDASLETEEGRSIALALLYLGPGRSRDQVRFETRVSFRPDRLRKIALAVPRGWGLGVDLAGGKTSPGIWGMVGRREDAVEVRAISPGRVVVRFGLTNIALFRGTACTILSGGATDLVQAVSETTGSEPRDYLLSTYLIHIAIAAREIGHGGTLLVLPRDQPAWDDTALDRGYRFDPPFSAVAMHYRATLARYSEQFKMYPDESPLLLLSYLPDMEPLLGDQDTPEGLALVRHAKNVGQFASIDGAVVLTRGLDVLGTGAFIKVPRARFPSDTKRSWREWSPGRNWVSKTGELRHIGGARHQSAAGYAWAERNRIAVVVSQDGSIAVLAWPDPSDRPILLRNLEQFVL